ncbi:hypothetical protein PAEPH01_1585 [Pancytospora epiphaga]|nr:hypothetical protein PAEPH01_1585 [Pancytospora epiphaga]
MVLQRDHLSNFQGSDFKPITCMSDPYKLITKCVARIMQMERSRGGLLAEN